MSTQDTTITIDGIAMPCYLARPEGDEPRPAVIVFQEIFGVNAEVKRIADLFASAGYVALAPNYYYRTHPALNEPYTNEGLQAGFAAAGRVTKANLRKDVAAIVEFLYAQTYVKHGAIAVAGFCFGGTVSVVAASVPGIAASIPFYGGHIAQPLPSGDSAAIADAGSIKIPMLFFFGGKDDYITPEQIALIESALTEAHVEHEIVVYPNVGHAFFRESSSKMDEHEVGDAWAKTLAFLKAHVG